ncbi:MAG: right-handed parallel beta-helix repeat-containing protein [Candidatus Bathyarchaeia archaeon]
MSRRKLAIFLAVLLVSVSFVSVEFVLHYPAPLGSIVVPVDYPTIQAAIDHAPPWSIIYVRNGVYNELLTINKPLTLLGESNQDTIIQGFSKYPLNSVTIEIEANDVTISNLMIDGYQVGIEITQEFSNCKITQNIIQNYTSFGIIAQYGNNQIISQNAIIGKNNSASEGISLTSSDSMVLLNSIQNNDLGIFVQSCNVTINGNIISNNGYVSEGLSVKGGLHLRWSGPYYIFDNTFTGNQGGGINFEGCNNTLVHNNYLSKNQVGLYLLNYIYINSTIGSKITVYQNDFTNNQEQVILSKSWLGYGSPLGIDANAVNGTDVVSWDSGIVGNYWGDYQTRYPDATQNNDTDTYNTPYTIDANNKDNHPLIQES